MKLLLFKNRRDLPNITFLFPKSNAGFTLIELMIAISIVGIFSVFLLVNFRANEDVRNFKRDSLAVIDGIKIVQTMSLSGQQLVSSEGGTYTPDGYAFVLEKCQQNCFYQIMGYQGSQDGGGEFYEAEKKFLNEEINVQSEKTTIIFFPPRGNVALFDQFNNTVGASIIKLGYSSKTIDPICISFGAMSGRISFTDCSE